MVDIIHTLSLISEFLGTLLIGIAILRVHTHVQREQKIDKDVILIIKREQKMTIVGLILITLGFILNFV